MIKISNSAKETFDIGFNMAREASAGDVYTLNGDLGVGKTVFVKGFAKGLMIDETVTSPTFTILRTYEEGRLPLYHFDVYRIGDPSEMDEIGYEELVYGDGVTLIEWAEIIQDILPEKRIDITIRKDFLKGEDYRELEIS